MATIFKVVNACYILDKWLIKRELKFEVEWGEGNNSCRITEKKEKKIFRYNVQQSVYTYLAIISQ